MRTEISYNTLRREFKIPFVELTMGRNSPAAAQGHHGTENGKCRCGKEYGHKGFYVPWRYGHAQLNLGHWQWFQLIVWINNEGHWGSYYSIGGWLISKIARKIGYKIVGITIGMYSRFDWRESPTGFRVQWPNIYWSRPYE